MRVKSMIILSTLIVLVIFLLIFKPINNKEYKNFEKLKAKEVENKDYTISHKKSDSRVLLIAIHGGGIEPGTTELIEGIAKDNSYSYYSFNGIKQTGNQSMHITSTHFDEPQGLDLVKKSLVTVSFHGYEERDQKHTYLGGLDTGLAKEIAKQLKKAGFSVSDAPKELSGKEKDNITNKNKRGKGVQLEISTAQREAFFKNNDLSSKNRKHKETTFYEYTSAIEAALKINHKNNK
ncbi:MAG TPA: poly-gamma-glutamate hydrolase family protein [Pseudogracilibacillus sp.]|nr:poly-gamma-glutamate hydrolase family protein [Pseudogracilibacillus sp.]